MTDAPTWRAAFDDAATRLDDRGEARRLVEHATGYDLAEVLDRAPTARSMAHFDAMLARRLAGEPLQYVLGGWGFRTLDVLVDRRVLIPRPETEVVVEHALRVAREIDARAVVDLGTGAGVIALSLAVERPSVTVWATDASADALDVARANLAGAGRAASRVELARGDWYAALPDELLGHVDLIVSNPPYVAADDVLPAEVREWEPVAALIAGPTGLECIEQIVDGAHRWLRPGGALVVEIGETQGEAVRALTAGFARVEVHPDLAGRPRVLVAVSPASTA